jgi:xanthine dehydrogenase accessory factor
VDIFEEIVTARNEGKSVVLATVVKTKGSGPRGEGARLLVRKDGSTVGTVGGGAIEKLTIEEAMKIMNASEPKLLEHNLKDVGMSCGGAMSVFLEPLNPAPQLFIFGAGHIGQVLCQIVKTMEFNVTVIDNRPDFANRERLPLADEVVAGEYGAVLKDLPFNDNTYGIIVTHKHSHDLEVLRGCISKPYKYVGMIGSRKKVDAILTELREDGVSEEILATIHAPIGLEIAANTPPEIAISISAELVVVRNGGQKAAAVSCSKTIR